MPDLHINIISFNIPYPPGYGGIIDVFYKIRALSERGVKIHLHCVEYSTQHHGELEALCEEVFYYRRSAMWKGFFSDKPFIVSSRANKELLHHLLKNDFPVFFEGLHCCYFLPDASLRGRIKIVRMHNDESAYYLSLARHEQHFLKRLYFYEEYRRLFRYENILQYADHIFCIAQHETEQYQRKFKNVHYLAPFHGNTQVTSLSGKGSFALYHANLSVNENEEAAIFLLQQIFNDLPYPLHIAGKNPSQHLRSEIKKYANHHLLANPDEAALQHEMQHAQVHILPAFTETGIKLKLLNALFCGRYCIVNSAMVKNTGLEKYCIIADDAAEIKNALDTVFQKSFTEEDIVFRKQIRMAYSDATEIQKVITLLQAHLPL